MSRLSFPSDQQAGVVNLAHVLDPMSADHSAALRSLIDTNGPGYTYRIPDGFTVKIPLQLEATAPRLRNHVYIEGEGPGSIISVTGYGPNPGNSYMAIGLTTAQQAEDIDGAGIRNLTILGDGPGATQTWTNRQASAVRILGGSQRQDNLQFLDVVFKNHDGFPLHCDANQTANHGMVERCQFINNGNGLNFNADFFTARHNYFTNCEGIECSGAANIFDGNVFLNVFAAAISSGGNQSSGTNKKALPGTRIVNNIIMGVLGGTGYGTGIGIITAQSSPDQLIANNYIERTYNAGIQTTHDGTGTLGPDDGATIANNHLVNCGNSGTGGGSMAMVIQAANNRVLANRAYNRTSLAGDPYPTGTSRALIGVSIQASGCVVIGNDFDMSNGGQYAVDFRGSATGIIWGVNRLNYGTGYAPMQVGTGTTFADGKAVPQEAYNLPAYGNPLRVTGKMMTLSAPTANQTNTLVSAVTVGPGYSQTFINTSASFTWAITPNGTEQINGVNAAKTLGVSSAVTLTSDGSNWIAQIHYGTFA